MKIAIMGSAPSSRKLAPFSNLNWEIWCCSPPNFDLPRVDKWFELHDLDRKLNHPKNAPFAQHLATHPWVYVYKQDPRIQNGKIFPWQPYAKKYPHFALSSQIGWMLAHAIEQKPKQIGMWGVDMSAESEYGHQRSGCQFFFWYMRNFTDIELVLPPQCDVAAEPALYGVKEHWPQYAKYKARKEELASRLHQAQAAIDQNSKIADALSGALDDMKYHDNTWVRPEMDWDAVPSE